MVSLLIVLLALSFLAAICSRLSFPHSPPLSLFFTFWNVKRSGIFALKEHLSNGGKGPLFLKPTLLRAVVMHLFVCKGGLTSCAVTIVVATAES